LDLELLGEDGPGEENPIDDRSLLLVDLGLDKDWKPTEENEVDDLFRLLTGLSQKV